MKHSLWWFLGGKLSPPPKKKKKKKKRKKKREEIDINIDNQSVMGTDLSKFLGVYMDKKLTCKTHISFIDGKIARGIGIFMKARKYFTDECMIILHD